MWHRERRELDRGGEVGKLGRTGRDERHDGGDGPRTESVGTDDVEHAPAWGPIHHPGIPEERDILRECHTSNALAVTRNMSFSSKICVLIWRAIMVSAISYKMQSGT